MSVLENSHKFQESDRGNYSCQINTEPITLSTGELDVKGIPFCRINRS